MARQPTYTEEVLQLAIQAVRDGLSQHQAAKQYGIPRTTLHDRLRGSLSIQAAKEPSQRLSSEQEGYLRDWVLAQASLGLPPTHRQLREFTTRILVASGDL
jgi:hypothetical protein